MRDPKVSKGKVKKLQSGLLRWFRENSRDFSWRRNRTPYRILIAEMMLRRTRAKQVEPIYNRFLKRFPTINSLANGDSREIRSLLKPLGLEWRANNIILVAKEIRERFGGDLPATRQELLSLPGVGPYVAGAVLCFAHGKPESVIDGNVVRVIGRFFGLRLDGEARRRNEMVQAATVCIPPHDFIIYNYALLDFAAGVCKPTQPLCDSCLLRRNCHFLNTRIKNEGTLC